ncbi:MAG TPA: complex I NDUFA9 subunit family protein [Methylomirabilota bacterium]|jgi:NADH dehydrogenase|nr:complex I NDUFA9 subunit family protein [Methylomirabilota bacterium]
MPIRKVFVTGGTGFVGRAVVQALRGEGCVVRCLVRRGSEGDLQGLGAIERVEGDVMAPQTLDEGMAGCDAVVHLVGIIREQPAIGATFDRVHTQGTVNVLDAAIAAGVRRYLHMSALGTRAEARSRYHRTKWLAEEAVRSSALPWTIFRPSIIYGRGDQFVTMLADLIERYPAVPVLGTGLQRLQPIPVAQVAAGFARALSRPATVKQVYTVAGPDAVTMLELLDRLGHAMGRRHVRKIHVPLGLVRPVAGLMHRFPGFPVTPDQLLMLEEENVGNAQPFFFAFDLVPVPLNDGLREMLG